MASFDFFSQPQGPAVSISLFGDATSAGINAGRALPTQLTAAIQGGLQGVENTMKYTQQAQQMAMNQNTIEQQPMQNQMRQEQLESMQMQNEITAIKRDIAVSTQDLTLRQEKSALEAQALQTESQLQSIKSRDDIAEKLQSNDPAEKLKILDDPQFKKTLLEDPKFAEGVLGQLYPLMTPDQRKAAGASLSFSKQRQYDAELEQTNAKARQKVLESRDAATTAFTTSAPFQYATQGVNNISDIPNVVKVFPKGVKTLSEEGKVIDDVPDRTQSDVDRGKYTVYKNGQPLLDVNEEEANKYFSFVKAQNEYNQTLRGNIFGEPINKPAPPPTPTPTAPPPGPASIPTFQQGGASQGASPIPSGNAQIVEQARQNFASLAQNPPPGMNRGTLEERLKERKSFINKGVSGIQQQKVAQQEALNTVRGAAQASANAPAPATTPVPQTSAEIGGAAATPTAAPSVGYSSPSEALSVAVKAPVSLRVETEMKVPKTTMQLVQTDSLLGNEPPIIKGLAAVESGGKRNAKSPTGVEGLLQVTRGTAAIYGLNRDIPSENVAAGKLYLYDNLLRFNGNLHLALAAYNAGPGLISEAIRETQSTAWADVRAYLKENQSAKKFKETSAYPDKVISASTQFLGKGGDGDSSLLMLLERNNLIKPQAEAA